MVSWYDFSMDKPVLDFLNSQRILILATTDSSGLPWVTNLYYVIDSKGFIYYFSSTKGQHSKHLETNQNIAWSVTWADGHDMSNRKGIQAQGTCTIVKSIPEMIKVAGLITTKFTDWEVDLKDLKSFSSSTRIYKIMTITLKYWDDELFGKKKYKEYAL